MKTFSKRVLVISLVTVSTVCALLQLLGVTIFNFPSFVPLQTLDEFIEMMDARLILASIVLTFNIVFMTSICANVKLKLETWLVSFIVSSLSQFIPVVDSRVFSTIMVLLIGFIFRSDSYRKVVFRYMNLMALSFVYQFISAFYKMGFVDASYTFTSSELLLFSVDSYALLIAIYIDKLGGENNEKTREKNAQWWRSLVYPAFQSAESVQGQRRQACTDARLQEIADIQSLSRWDKVLMTAVALLQLGVVTAACTLNGKFVVFVIAYLAGFLPQRIATQMSYHARTALGCGIQSAITFFVVTAIIPSVGTSVFLPVIVGTAIVSTILTLQKIGVLKYYGAE